VVRVELSNLSSLTAGIHRTNISYYNILLLGGLYLISVVLWWRLSVRVNTLVLINKVARRRSRLVPGTFMGDRPQTGKPSLYITSHQGQLHLLSFRGW